MPRQLVKKCAALALTGTLAVAGADLCACHLAETRAAALLAGHPGWRVGAIRATAFAREIVLDDLSAQAGGARVVVGRVHLPARGIAGLIDTAAAETAGAPPPAAGTIRADDVVLMTGTTTVHIKRIDLAGTNLTNADLAALLDPKSADSVEARLRKLTATAVVIPEIAIDDPTAGSERHALLHQILLADVSGGKAAAVSAADASIAMTDGEAAVNGASGAIEASGVDLPQVAHVLAHVSAQGAGASRNADAEPIRPLFDKAVVNAPRLANVAKDAALAATSVTATSVAARPITGALPLAGATTLDPTGTLQLRDLARCLSIGALDVDGLASHGKSGGEETQVTATHVGLTALSDGKVGGISLRDFHLDGPYAKLAIGTAEIGAFEIPAPPLPGGPRVAARPGQLALGQVAVAITSRDRPEAGPQLRFTIDRVAITQEGGPSAIPASGSATASNLAFDVTPDGTLTHVLYAMGYRHVALAATLSSSYDAGAKELKVDRLALAEPTMGSIELALRLADVSPDVLSTDPETAQDSAMAVLAKSLDLKIANAGLFEKAIAYKAQQDGVSVADERTSGVDFFANKLPLILGDTAGAKAIGGAIAKFIADPKTLHIALASKDGLGVGAIGMLGDPGALLDSLDIHASADD